MGRIVYVNGSIEIKTQYFVPKDLGVLYLEAPKETNEIIEPKDEVEGERCLIIDDDHPQSMFNEYYARGDVSTEFMTTSYLSASYLDSINEYKKRIEETCEVVKMVAEWRSAEQQLVYKMVYVNILTSLDAFICYVLLKRGIQDEDIFKSLMYEVAPKGKKELWDEQITEGHIGEWEQDAIKFVQETSFLNVDKIDKLFNCVRFDRLNYDRREMKKFFRMRHLIVHRNGKQRDDTEVIVSYRLLSELINATHTLVGAIFDSICLTLDREMKNSPAEKDIDDIFPGGVVKAPFKLSDLIRLLRSAEKSKAFDPIKMPML